VRPLRLVLVGGLVCGIVLGLTASGADRAQPARPHGERIRRAATPEELQPSVEAAFQAESYQPGDVAELRFFGAAPGVRLRVFHLGPERVRTVGRNELEGVQVAPRVLLGSVEAGRIASVRVGDWPTGLYFARLDSADGRVGFAPFVVGPRRLGEHRVAVVLPTYTWQAYNIRDDDGDGVGNTWYADRYDNAAALYRPFLNRGVPYGFKNNDLHFLHWLDRHGKRVDFLTDEVLDRTDAAELARAYDLIVFPGHHEYVTTREYDAVEGYRDLGGNLAFLSADNFYWQVVRHGDVLERTKPWRELGRPEAALIGAQYIANMPRFGRYVVQDAPAVPWLFAGTGLGPGSPFGHGGIEIDAVAPASPPNVEVVARIPDVFGPGRSAEMTVYRASSGALVFDAGAFTLAGGSRYPTASRIIENLWRRMTRDRGQGAG
jgi:hypothetical protein